MPTDKRKERDVIKAVSKGVGALFVTCILAGCSNIDRSLIFFTHTNMGLELSVDTTQTSPPVKLIIGYKRAEGVLNPVYDKDGVEVVTTTNLDSSGKPVKTIVTKEKYLDEAYSVLAKIVGDISGSSGSTATGKLAASQWFATGKAAKLLAKKEATAAALIGSEAGVTAAVEAAKKFDQTEQQMGPLLDGIIDAFDARRNQDDKDKIYDKALELKIFDRARQTSGSTKDATNNKWFKQHVTLYSDFSHPERYGVLKQLKDFIDNLP